MSHQEQLGFFAAVAAANEHVIASGRILEIGSYDVNGSVRQLFSQAPEYVGVDLVDGPGVDLVEFGHRVSCPDGYFDVSISGECFEHDPYWRDTFRNMVRLTKPGGLVAFTCASRGRPEHGTSRSRRMDSPGTQSAGFDHYGNLSARDFSSFPLDEVFSSWRFWYVSSHFDLFFAGVRAGNPHACLPDDADVKKLAKLMPWKQRVERTPLHLLLRILPEHSYQRVALPYWRALGQLHDRIRPGTPDPGEMTRRSNHSGD